jgi:hypothetical protein
MHQALRGMLLAATWWAAFCTVSNAEIIDRIAVTVDARVITQSELFRQIRLIAFQNGEKPDYSKEHKREIAGKLVQQILIRREIEQSRYLNIGTPNIDAELAALKKSRYPTNEAYEKGLAEYNITDGEVRLQLQWQMTLVSFIDVRFSPEVQLKDSEIEDYYNSTYLPDWHKNNTGMPPSLDDARAEIESILTAQRTETALDRWLGQTRRQSRIRFHAEVFQ